MFGAAGIIVKLPFRTRTVCLPVTTRLCRPKTGPTKVETAASTIRWLAVCHRGRKIHVVAKLVDHGKALRHLPGQITVTTRLPADVLYGLAPAPDRQTRPASAQRRPPRQPSRPRPDCKVATAQVRRYGRTDTVRIAEIQCLWYGSFHTQTVRVVLIRDDDTDTGYGLALVTTDPQHPGHSAGHPLRLALVDRGDLPRNT